MSNIGFIGLGIMGRPMVANLIKGGHTLFVHNRSAPSKEVLDLGATVRFVAGGPSPDWTILVRRTNGDAGDPGLPGITFRQV